MNSARQSAIVVIVLLLLAHDYLTENILHMSKVGRDVDAFTGSLFSQFSQPERGLCFYKITLLKLIISKTKELVFNYNTPNMEDGTQRLQILQCGCCTDMLSI